MSPTHTSQTSPKSLASVAFD